MRVPRRALYLGLLPVSAFISWAAGCAASGGGASHTSGTGGAGSVSHSAASSSSSGVVLTGSGGTGGSTCTGTGLECQIHSCPGSLSTTITGTIYDPAGKNPLYGVVAYVPNTKPAPLIHGTTCYSCSDLYTGDPIAAAVTDASGRFTIKNAPDGTNIPLVVQIGKWRRQFVIPAVGLCAQTAVPNGTLTLPKNGSEGDLPDIAVSTGAADTVECLLFRVGVDKAEYVPGASTAGHVHIFASAGAPNTSVPAPAPEVALWDSPQDMMQYDIVMLSCEGHETDNMNQQALFDFAAAGGRVFASHLHYAWFYTGPFSTQNLATWLPEPNYLGDINATAVSTTWDGMPFPRGQAFHDWLLNVNALTNNLLPITAARHNADVTVLNAPSQPWIVGQGTATEPQDFSFDTPLGAAADKQCGRVVYTDMHVGAASADYGGTNKGIAPDGCVDSDLTPQEKALEFNLFDLSTCVTPNNTPQMPPATK
jgi:hypothetical protein